MPAPIDGQDVSSFKTQYKTATESKFPDAIMVKMGEHVLEFVKSTIPTRYGTNPNQPFALYVPEGREYPLALTGSKVVKAGKGGFSLTNLHDASQAMNTLKYFDEPASAVMKHLVPCGFQVSSDMSQVEIYQSARDCDPRSAFGSVTAFNRHVDAATAEEIMGLFTEVVVAPGYDGDALEILARNEGTPKKNNAIRILQYPTLEHIPKFDGDGIYDHICFKTLVDGTLAVEAPYLSQVRSVEDLIIHPRVPKKKDSDEYVVAEATPTDQQLQDALTAWYLNINVRSNGIVIVKNGQAIAVGTGQQERIGAVEQAVYKAVQKGHKAGMKGSVMSSDAFFPDRGCIDHIAKYGVGAVIWPSGSLNDKSSIEAANEHSIALIVPKSGERCFLHV